VLGDLLGTSRSEERRGLLHEGVGRGASAAYVELVLDNADGRIPVDSLEVRLRRTISLKKDEYSLDRKHVTKTEVVNLLESAGFSRANPYYIVQQGKIRDLAVMTDKNRLGLLKEVGGTKIYEERRKESLDLMKDASLKKKEIEEMLAFFEDKVAELEGDKEELVQYLQLDKQRRVIEYSIFDKDLRAATASLEEIERKREEIVGKSNAAHEDISRAKVERKKAEKESAHLAGKLEELRSEQKELSAQKLDESQRKAALELELEDLRAAGKDSVDAHQSATAQISDLCADISAKEDELGQVEASLRECTSGEKAMEAGISQREQRLQQLYQKEGRKTQFSSKQERDKWIKKEVKEIESVLKKKEASLAALEKTHAQASKTQAEQEAQIAAQGAEQEERESEQEGILKELKRLRKEKGELQEARKMLWKTESKLEKEVTAVRSNMQKKERQVDSSVARDIQNGLKSLQRIVKQHNIAGVHGPVIELFECKDTYNTAVEATAGNVLFHVVVDSDEVATRIISYLNRENGGRLSFIPLNRIQAPRVTYPTQYGKDVIPLLKVVKHQPVYQRAMAHVFGRTLLCRTIDLASEVALSANLNCVTLDGDQASHKGSLTGGYYEERHSKLENMKQLREIRAKHEDLVAQSAQLKGDISGADQNVSRILGEIQKHEAKYNRVKSQLQSLAHDLKTARAQVATGKKQAASREASVEEVRQGVAQLQDQHKSLGDELGTELVSQLSAEEQEEIRALNAHLKSAHKDLMALQTKRTEVETTVINLKMHIEENLLKQKASLEAKLKGIGNVKVSEESAEEKEAELERVLETLGRVSEQESQAEKETDLCQAKLRDLEAVIERSKSVEASAKDHEEAQELDKLTSRKQHLLHRRHDLENKIRDLGSLPSDAFLGGGEKSKKSLLQMSGKVQKQLKGMSHVNKKALDQYMEYTEQRDEYSRRFDEQEREEAKIKELVAALDVRKDELLARTYRGVAKAFSETFVSLVGEAGHGALIMIRDAKPGGGYAGVSCRVSFGGEETKRMEQLSGGQKSLVALCLILSIQRIDRAPFYLFDEVDAALDPNYRAAVANVLAARANEGAQFITTTFHPEQVLISDQCYGVTFKNKVSTVDLIDRDEAMKFVTQKV